MKNITFILTGFFLIFMIGCSEQSPFHPAADDFSEGAKKSMHEKSKKPMPQLVGHTEEFFSPQTFPYLWVGTIDFSDYDEYGVYGIGYNILEFPEGEGNAQKFSERFVIFIGDSPLTGTILLSGITKGIVRGGEFFLTNGTVDEASGDFEDWMGRKVHVRGTIETDDLGNPLRVESEFRLN